MQPKAMSIPQFSPAALARLLDGEDPPALLDVRTEAEHARVALPGSLLIPLQELQDRAAELEPLRGKKVVVYCHHGVRSLSGAAFLLGLGFDAASLQGGIDRYAKDVDPRLPLY